MKVNFKNSLINNNMLPEHIGKLKQNEAEINTKQNYNAHRPAKEINFSGSAVSLGQKFVQNKTINKLTDFVWGNEAGFIALYSLGLAGVIKPLLILNQKKGSEEKDRQIIATKNFLQAFIGSFMSLTIGGGIVKKAVDIVKNDLKLIEVGKNGEGKSVLNVVSADSEHAKEVARHLLAQENNGLSQKIKTASEMAKDKNGLKKAGSFIKGLFKKVDFSPAEETVKTRAEELVKTFADGRFKIFEKNVPFVEKILSTGAKALPEIRRNGSTTTFYEAFESFWKNSTGWITAIMKAKVSSLLLPTVMAFLFTKNALEKRAKKEEGKPSPLMNNQDFQKENEKFKVALNKTTTPISFKGKVTNALATALANGVERFSMTTAGEGAVTKLAKFKKPSARMADLESILLTTYWLQNTTRSKKIDPDQKLGLNIQTALVTVVSSLTAALIDKALDKPMKKIESSFGEVLTSNISNLKEEIKNGKDVSNLQATIKEACSNLAGSAGIAKKLAQVGLNDEEALKGAIGELTKSYGKKLSKLKSLTIFTLIVRLIIPVAMVPIGGTIKNKFKQFKAKHDEQMKAKNAENKKEA